MTDFNIYAGSAPTPSGCGSWFTHSTSGNACNSIFCATSPTTCVGDCKMLFVSTLRTPQKIEINDIVYVGTDTGYEILPEGWYVSSTNGTVFNIDSSGVLTSVNTCSGSTYVRDYDGNYYGTAVIGTQTWFTENLRTTRYNNGIAIPYITNKTTWRNLKIGAYSSYENAIDNCFGYLYNWYVVENAGGLCPTGWHVPTEVEYETLGTYLGGNGVAGGKMKTKGFVWWNSPNDSATNQSGFNAYPAGRRLYNGNFNFFGETATFWTQTNGSGANFKKLVQLKYNNDNLDFQPDDPNNGYSIRCIKD
jgi:uncharacterized protein (TIGR02145 family)